MPRAVDRRCAHSSFTCANHIKFWVIAYVEDLGRLQAELRGGGEENACIGLGGAGIARAHMVREVFADTDAVQVGIAVG